jgi:hypothetical protein
MPNKPLSGRVRLAIGASIIWVLLVLFYFQESREARLFLLIGALPIVTGWVLIWVYRGFRGPRKSQPERRSFKRLNRDQRLLRTRLCMVLVALSAS